MTLHQESFHSFKARDFGFAFLGDDKTCSITGMVQVKIALDDDVLRTFGEVWYVLELRKNLISYGTL